MKQRQTVDSHPDRKLWSTVKGTCPRVTTSELEQREEGGSRSNRHLLNIDCMPGSELWMPLTHILSPNTKKKKKRYELATPFTDAETGVEDKSAPGHTDNTYHRQDLNLPLPNPKAMLISQLLNYLGWRGRCWKQSGERISRHWQLMI